jgi:MFS family permease
VANLLFFSMEALLVLFARDQLGIPTRWIGWFFGGHALLGAAAVVVAPRLARFIGLGRSLVLGLAMLGTGFLAMTLLASEIRSLVPWASTVTAIGPAGLAVAGASLTNVAFFTMRQQITPEPLLGRVIAASRTLSWVGIPVGATIGGRLGDVMGIRPVYLAASLTLLVLAAGLLLTPLWLHRTDPETLVEAGRKAGDAEDAPLYPRRPIGVASTDWLGLDRD